MVFFSVNLRWGTWGHVGATSGPRPGSVHQHAAWSGERGQPLTTTEHGLKLIFSSFKRLSEFCRSYRHGLTVLRLFFVLFDAHTHTPTDTPRSLPSGARTHNCWGRTRTNTAEWPKQNVPAGCGVPRADSGWLAAEVQLSGLSGYSIWYIYIVISFKIILEIDGICTPHFFHIYIYIYISLIIGWVPMTFQKIWVDLDPWPVSPRLELPAPSVSSQSLPQGGPLLSNRGRGAVAGRGGAMASVFGSKSAKNRHDHDWFQRANDLGKFDHDLTSRPHWNHG